jgi:hypothetical protein
MKVKFFTAILLSFLLTGMFKSETGTFTISAEVEKSSVVDMPKIFVRDYIKDLNIFPKYFPDIVSVKTLDNAESEWVYAVDAPLAPTYYLKFILVEKESTPDVMLLESKVPEPDYLFCKAVFDSLGENSTRVSIKFKIKMTRENASDVHFMAGLLGENFISARMKDKLDGDLESFIERAIKDMYKKYNKSH